MNKYIKNPDLADLEIIEKTRLDAERKAAAEESTNNAEAYLAEIQDDAIETRSLMTEKQLNSIDSSTMRSHLRSMVEIQRQIATLDIPQEKIEMQLKRLGVETQEELITQIETLRKYLDRES